jgi:hypothetical protein
MGVVPVSLVDVLLWLLALEMVVVATSPLPLPLCVVLLT